MMRLRHARELGRVEPAQREAGAKRRKRMRVEDEGVAAATAGHEVDPSAAVDDVRAARPGDHVRACVAGKRVSIATECDEVIDEEGSV